MSAVFHLGTVCSSRFAAGYLETEKHFRRIMGYEHPQVLIAKLQEIAEMRLARPQSTPPVSDEYAVPLTKEVA